MLEQALPSYFDSLHLNAHQLPEAGHTYARQYTGITQHGKRLVYGRFFPVSDELMSGTGAAECREISDGGNRYWSVVFDPMTRTINAFLVNGVA